MSKLRRGQSALRGEGKSYLIAKEWWGQEQDKHKGLKTRSVYLPQTVIGEGGTEALVAGSAGPL